MMFKRSKNKIDNPGKQRIADRIVNVIWRIQLRWASIMSRIATRLSSRGRKISFYLFIVISSLICTCIVVQSFHASRSVYSFGSIRVPASVTNSGEGKAALSMQSRMLPAVDSFRRYIDSLRKTTSGKHIADSLLSSRPQLMDSIQIFEKLYLKQQ